MIMTFGTHKGKALEALILRDPDYIMWMLGKQDVTAPLRPAQIEAKRLISIFNEKPFTQRCYGRHCKRRAKRCTVIRNVIDLYWWCSKCEPEQRGGIDLRIISTYEQAIDAVRLLSTRRKSDQKEIIRIMAQAKGLMRFSKVATQRFFHQDE